MSDKVGNVYFLPNLKEKLISRALQFLDKENFDEAIPLLYQALDMDNSDGQAKMLLLTALHETNQLQKAKKLAEALLEEPAINYFEVMDVYILILIHLKEYDLVVTMIEQLLSENKLTYNKKDQYLKLLEMNTRFAKTKQTEQQSLSLSTLPIAQQIEKIGMLANVNIHPYTNELKAYVSMEENHPFVQTMILMLLKEHGYSKDVKVSKCGYSEVVIPEELNQLFDTPLFLRINQALTDKVEQNNPSAYLQIHAMMQRHFYLMYPFEMGREEENRWVVAYLLLGQEMYGEEQNEQSLLAEYGVTAAQLSSAQSFLNSLDKISLPNL